MERIGECRMDKMVKFIDLYWSIEYCNLNCPYCYIHQHRENKGKKYQCSHTPAEIRKALSKKRLGGAALLNICAGGETLLEEQIIPILYELLEEGHYISIVTNGTITENIKKLLKFSEELRRHLFFKFSFHYGELERVGRLEEFFNTVKMVQKAEASFSIELPAYDKFIPKSEEIMKLCKEKIGALPHIATLRDESKAGFPLLSEYSFDKLNKIWSIYDSDLFRIRSETMEKKYRGFCYAGDWTFTANLESGEIKQCFHERVIGNLYQETKLEWEAVGDHCHSEYCYACHSFLTLGVIPDLKINTSYNETRDREDAKWLNREMKEFMHQKLFENNREYSALEKNQINKKNRNYEMEKYESPSDFSNKVMVSIKNQMMKNNYCLVEARHFANLIYEELPEELLWLNHIYSGWEQGRFLKDTVPIVVTALGKQSEKAAGDEIWIVGLLVDQCYYDAEDIFEKTWLKKNRMLGWRSYENELEQKIITGYIPKGKKTRLILERNRWRGICRIQFKGKEREIDTFGDCEDGIMYVSLI